ncbi:MAG: CapA family protein, partial [bacterium]|nr:CapA family protein [bacterium]
MNLDLLFETGSIDFGVEHFSETEWTLSATGDYGILPQTGKYICSAGSDDLARNINRLIAADISIANLEIALTEPANAGGPGVRGDREVFMEFHKAAPFTVYSLANNHVRDAGADELRRTLERFSKENIRYVGAGSNQTEAEAPRFLEIKGVKLGIQAFAQNENQIADNATPGTAELLPDKVLSAAEKLVSQCNVPIVIMHEGFEFMDFPRAQLRSLCNKLVESGVKLVICHHSHVPQGIEKIGDSLIFYSLGNFLFDQPHFAHYPWSRQSFVPVIKFNGSKIAGVELRPLFI